MKYLSLPRTFAAALAWSSCLALAHDGHGLANGSHWHATDTLGLLLGAVAVGVGVWIARGGK
ncbi:MAG: hypothetical protein RIS88_1101 [Pseudomonadota bacterium]|jgi:hypothetical protein